jgi:predicted GIY-YIG superfamily endonuclease
MEKKTKHYCYILKNNNEGDINKTYNGYTVNPCRRIRQHNQEIKGGAKYTKKYGDKKWEMYVLLSGLPDKNNALQCEWKIKHPDNKKRRSSKYNTDIGRINGLIEVINQNKWTNNSIINNSDMELELIILKDYEKKIKEIEKKIPKNITVIFVDSIIEYINNINK